MIGGVSFGGAPFTDISSRRAGCRPKYRRVRPVLDGTGNSLLAAEVVQGQGGDLRGFSWYGPSSVFTSFLGSDATRPDLEDASYCVYPSASGVRQHVTLAKPRP